MLRHHHSRDEALGRSIYSNGLISRLLKHNPSGASQFEGAREEKSGGELSKGVRIGSIQCPQCRLVSRSKEYRVQHSKISSGHSVRGKTQPQSEDRQSRWTCNVTSEHTTVNDRLVKR
ncbi:uncharacterized protein STEHIDRAFT_148477 [Stereum hirsutum FP-91666 SS1]|uniref:uncharacterized protein n=1 Tax=Stereum hirsutum (strain FP-91666) TaxID=721885 RepID=UPI000444A21D|nr:uncharacterized protein STEHIDRAFT_148477 [Stereum hirsutum FP-91666 SS1]EIM84418.1 hypothetical protein STEHIDRAFT_148477 [Stereum hirsutum FP-91666 SS1]